MGGEGWMDGMRVEMMRCFSEVLGLLESLGRRFPLPRSLQNRRGIMATALEEPPLPRVAY